MFLLYLVLLALLGFPAAAQAQTPSTIPGPADAGRIDMQKQQLPELRKQDSGYIAPQTVDTEAPSGAEDIRFILTDVQIKGVTVFSKTDLERIYGTYTGQEISLDMVWRFAAAITQLYREKGYFLSRAYVPAQDIHGGVITLHIVEGYIGNIVFEDVFAKSYVTNAAIKKLLARKPTKADEVESFLLSLNDLPGLSFRAVLAPAQDPAAPEGSVDLLLHAEEDDGKGVVRLDNNGSRFLGPHEIYAYYETSFLPLHKTSLSLLSSLPMDELKNAAIKHSIAVAPSLMFELGGSITLAQPGHKLKTLDLKSRSVSWETALIYQWLRQRNENISLRLALNGRNTTSNLAGTPFTRDRIVALRASVAYDLIDEWHGQNLLGFTLSQGIDGLGSSDERDAFLSRAAAEPDFTKLELSATRVQALPGNFLLQGSIGGQIASDALYSSEEYGYGGLSFGRAYDSSELTGDEGISGSLELQYNAWRDVRPLGITPYIFYDIGKIWNEDAGQSEKATASSAGFGIRFDTLYQVSGDIGVAYPLTNSIDNPLYGGNGKNPRILLQISKQF